MNPKWKPNSPDLKPYIDEFKTHGYTTIPDFLIPDQAKTISNFLLNMNETWWYKTIYTQGKKDYRELAKPNIQDKITQQRQIANQIADNGKFAYSFNRTFRNHTKICYCQECKFYKKIIQSPKLTELLSSLTGQKITKPGEIFASRYVEGDFLNIHTDSNSGKIATVINLTPKWNPAWGGNLHILKPNRHDVHRVIVPTYNTLSIFNLPEDGTPHFVSQISKGVTAKRIAITGWFR